MAVFFGEMQTRSDAKRMKAVVTVDRGNIRLSSGTAELGEWPLSRVRLEEYTDTSVLMAVEDEELILFLEEKERFAGEVGKYLRNPSEERRRATHPAFRRNEPQGPTLGEELKDDVGREMAPIVAEAKGWIDQIPRGRPLIIGAIVFLVLLVVFPQPIAFATLIGGALALLAGGLAYSDDRIAVRLPDPVNPVQLVAGGGIALVVGIIILAIF